MVVRCGSMASGWRRLLTVHPAFAPIVDARARIYDLAHEQSTQAVMSYVDEQTGQRCAVGSKPPLTREDWIAKRTAVDTVLDDLRGIVTRVGDETVGEMWSLYDGQDVLNEIDPSFSQHIRHHVRHAALADPFHVSANTDPKGDRARRPQDQDPDVLLHVTGETDTGIVVRGAKFETAAAYANQAFVKPTIGDWGDAVLSDYAVGFVADMAAPGVKHICRSTFAGRASSADYPLSNRCDEIDTLIVFDDVEIPWENVFFYRHTRAAAFIRATLHRYSMFPFVQRHLRLADLLVGVAYTTAAQTGVRMHQGVREKLAELACYREGINAHLSAAIEFAEPSPGGLLMPNQALLFTGRVLACSQLPAMMHLARDLCGGQLCVTPSAAAFAAPDTGPLLHKKYLAVGERRRRGAPQAVRVRARPAEFRLRRPPPDLPAVRAVAGVRAPAGRLQQLRLRGPGGAGPPLRRPVRERRRRWRGRRARPGPARSRALTDLNVIHAAQLACVRDRGAARRGHEQGELDLIADGAVAIRDGVIVAAADTATVLREHGEDVPTFDASGMTVLPGLIECHSHPLFAGSRHAEYALRLAGASLAEIAAAGGGIWASVQTTRAASPTRPCWQISGRRTRASSRGGVTTLEVKSGYGLTAESELRQLGLLERSRTATPMSLVITFLGAHVCVPADRDADAYAGEVLEMLDRVIEQGIAAFHDITCERGLFTPAQARRLFERSRGVSPSRRRPTR